MSKISSIKALIKKRLNYDKSISVGGVDFQVPVQGLREVHISEPWMHSILNLLFSRFPGDFVDVGVNLGQTLLIARSLDSKRGYIGFEPNIVCAAYAQEIIRSNAMSNSAILPVALYDRNSVVDLNFTNKSGVDSCASIIKDFRPENPVVESQTALGITPGGINGLFQDLIGVIKIDVEGAEFLVLESLKEILKRDRPAIVVEIMPAYSIDNSRRVENNKNIEDFCERLGYKIFRIKKGQKTEIDHIDEIGIHGDLSWCDYVLLPEGNSL